MTELAIAAIIILVPIGIWIGVKLERLAAEGRRPV